ncbi:hypothetical protein, conserved [Babesia bigemina]|uniref:C3H1-type domain-containing protein n=1 Tax=Babesia bigemina TaxID=5866 RepID=A0A061BR41_BABBI|nr:hypothetical protein, conserved [Babesia bigemina]CDR71918.1 hypothetical protein, conserved [Babesia bigemina]|eukprot:XP_012770860.1 hypothetical protein, conserved [Babesia bigemina]
MGFLSGVLGAVKDDDAVKTYDDMMSNKLETVLKEVNKQIGSGRAGLAASVEQVKGWLEGYEGEIKKRTEAITDPLKIVDVDIQKTIKNHFRTMKSLSFQEQYSTWTNRARLYLQKAEEANKVLEQLDPKLSGKLTINIEMLLQAMKKFEEEASDRDLVKICEMAGEKLMKVLNSTDGSFQESATELRGYLQGVLDESLKKLNGLCDTSFAKLMASVNTELFDAFHKVNDGIDDLLIKYDNQIVKGLQPIVNGAVVLKKKVESEKRTLMHQVTDLGVRMNELTEAAKRIKEYVENTQVAQFKNGAGWELEKQVEELIGAIETNVRKHIMEIFEHIKEPIGIIKVHIGDIKVPRIPADPEDKSIYHNWSALKEEIQTLVGKIKGEGLSGIVQNKDGLNQIVKGIMIYAANFTATKFETKVLDMWLDCILKNNEIVKDKLKSYIGGSRNAETSKPFQDGEVQAILNGQTKSLHDSIKKAIKGKLKGVYGGGKITFVEEPTGTIDTDLQAVQDVCLQFATKLDQEVNEAENVVPLPGSIETVITKGIGPFSEQITKAIDEDMNLKKTFTPAAGRKKHDLQEAIKLMIPALSTAARQVYEELNLLTNSVEFDIKIGRVNEAISNVGKIEYQFDMMPKNGKPVDHGNKIDTALGIAHTHIRSLHDDVHNGIKQASNQLSSENLTGALVDKVKVIKEIATKEEFNGRLDLLLQQTANKAIDRLQRKVNLIVNGSSSGIVKDPYTPLTNTLEGIKAMLVLLQTQKDANVTTGVEHGKSTLEKTAYDLNMTIETFLTDSVGKTEQSPDTVYNALKILHEKIGMLMKKVYETRKNVGHVEQELYKCINYVEMLRSAVPQRTNKILKTLHADVDATITEGFKEIQNEAKWLYAQRKQKELTSLQKCLDIQLEKITKTINDDLSTGVKGLLKKTKRYFDANTDQLISQNISSLSTNVNVFIAKIMSYVAQQTNGHDISNQVKSLSLVCQNMFSQLHDSQHFDYKFSTNINNLNNRIDSLTPLSSSTSSLDPQALPDAGRPVLKALKQGMLGFVGELEKGYVNRYDGGEGIDKLSNLVITKSNSDVNSGSDAELTDDGRKLSKVFLTILETLYHQLHWLSDGCAKQKKRQINLQTINEKDRNMTNPLGAYFQRNGYQVSKEADSHDGELRNKKELKAENISGELLKNNLKSANSILTQWKQKSESTKGSTQVTSQITLLDVLDFFHEHLISYFKTSHLRHISAPKAPCNIYQMLQWLTGLRHNPMYDKLCGHFKGLFKKPEGPGSDKDSEYNLESTDAKLNAKELSDELRRVCNYSVDVLVAIQGHGHADGVYAVDFYTNQSNITYPSSAGACFDMLVDVSNRVYEQLTFIYKICQNGPESGGWRDCQYGQHVAGSAWNCNKKQCANQTCPQIADQNANQNANQNGDQNAGQNCDRHPTCGVKSPLQSFLEDGLQGFLPHQFKAPGCKLECAVPNHFGKPCKTPMGFRDIGIVASHTQNGTHLRDAVYKLCGDVGRPLTRLCAITKCLLKTPPQTLGDIFGFFQGYLANWSGITKPNKEALTHKSVAFISAVKEAYFGNEYEFNLPSLFASSSHRNTDGTHKKGDLFSITSCESSDEATCGMYVQSVNLNLYSIFAASNNKQYLSWVVYISETFYALLKALLDECCKNCDTAGTRCHDKSCVADCAVKGYYNLLKSNNTQAAVMQLDRKNHDSKCHSIVECQNTHPTLYKYGFTFGSQHRLSGLSDSGAKKRTCKDFCSALKSILNDKEEVGAALAKLVYRTIPEYLWKIREPFSYLVLALWLLSLLYLIHIFIIRLDLLHIKSHLHSPSSHRIAAQSLLAAARVNKLGRVFYLQP